MNDENEILIDIEGANADSSTSTDHTETESAADHLERGPDGQASAVAPENTQLAREGTRPVLPTIIHRRVGTSAENVSKSNRK